MAALLLHTVPSSLKSVQPGQALKSRPKASPAPWNPKRHDASPHSTPQLYASGNSYEVAVDSITFLSPTTGPITWHQGQKQPKTYRPRGHYFQKGLIVASITLFGKGPAEALLLVADVHCAAVTAAAARDMTSTMRQHAGPSAVRCSYFESSLSHMLWNEPADIVAWHICRAAP